MKRIFVILLLLCNHTLFSQGFGLSSTSEGFIGTSVLTVSSRTYNAGDTYLFFITTTRTGAIPSDNPTVSSGSLVLVKQNTVTGFTYRMILYTCHCASTVTTTITFTYAEAQNVHFFAIYGSSNLGGLEKIYSATNSGSGADPTITLPLVKNSHNVGVFFNNVSTHFGGSPESGWTEDFDQGIIGFSQAGYHKNSTTDNTIQVTASASDWIGVGVQYSIRRVMNIK